MSFLPLLVLHIDMLSAPFVALEAAQGPHKAAQGLPHKVPHKVRTSLSEPCAAQGAQGKKNP